MSCFSLYARITPDENILCSSINSLLIDKPISIPPSNFNNDQNLQKGLHAHTSTCPKYSIVWPVNDVQTYIDHSITSRKAMAH